MKRKETIKRAAATKTRLALACVGALAAAPALALDHSEYVALRAIYDATNGDSWIDSSRARRVSIECKRSRRSAVSSGAFVANR